MTVLVSVNCITYNQEAYIRDAIESVLMQITDFQYELLIGEDCSTDSTLQIVEEYAKEYPDKIRIITSERNVGARQNSVRLQRESKGKYIAICEGDDYWIDPYKLQKQVDYMEANPTCTLCFHNAFLVRGAKKEEEKKPSLIKKSNLYYNKAKSNYNAGELALLGFIPTSSFIYRREFMDHPPEWYYTAVVGDNALKLITTSHGYAHFIDDNLGVYRIEVKNSMMDKWKKEEGQKEKQIARNQGYIELLDNFNRYSNYIYDNQIKKAKVPFEVLNLGLSGNRKRMKSEEYKEYFSSLNRKERFIFAGNIYFPKSLSMLVRLKSFL
ncbi:glycosyltransferase [Sporosarcina koreensis]|uniref:glycosyltransferase n=1 Tax=Bacillales TaxID=1385 RepID=UPI0007532D47|nr:glycosyltransferase [Sporosarcina koreensis]